MAHDRPPAAVETAHRQMRTVRRWHHLREAQRALFVLIAIAASTASVLLLLALFAPGPVFAASAWAICAAATISGGLLAHETRRHWLRGPRMLAWIDEQGGLDGRLRTLLELHEGDRPVADRFFMPLLASENAERLPSWEPRRLFRHRVPQGALTLAFTTVIVFLIVLVLAPAVRPLPPQILFADGQARSPRDGPLAPPANPVPGERDTVASDESSLLARLPGELQEQIRKHLWGETWDRTRNALARAEREAGGAGEPAPGEPFPGPGDADEEPWELARRPPDDEAGRRQPGLPRGSNREAGQSPDAATRDADAEPGDDATTEAGGSATMAAGAGNTTDPNLFGPATDTDAPATGSFDLALTTRMRLRLGGDRRAPAARAPAAAPDQEPTLAGEQRGELAAHKMPIPVAYESIVREVFAHRPLKGDTTP